ncbi:HAD family hydrolase [soil metagenome]
MLEDPQGKTIQGMVIDAVGTLIDPVPSVGNVYAEAARRQGVEIRDEEVRERFKRSFGADEVDDLRGPLATDEAIEQRRWRRIVADVLPGLPDPERAFNELWNHFARPSAWQCYPDVHPALKIFFQLNLNICIGSNFDGRLRGVLLGLPELNNFGPGLADSVVISSEVGRRKPHPDFYAAACDRLDLPADRVLFVGDDLENDLQGPRRAGLQAVLIDRSGQFPGDIPRLPDLLALANKLTQAAA